MTQLNAILDAQSAAQMSIEEYLALDRDEAPPEAVVAVGIRTRSGIEGDVSPPEKGSGPHSCEFERECYEATGVQAWKRKRGELVQVYRCGFIGMGTVSGCPKRKKYLNGGAK